MSLRIYLTPDKYLQTNFELYDTAEEVKFQIMTFLNVPREYHPYFGLYEIIEYPKYNEETFIEDFVRVSDVVGTFEHIFDEKNIQFISNDI